MVNVFLSYAPEDFKFVKKIKTELEKIGNFILCSRDFPPTRAELKNEEPCGKPQGIINHITTLLPKVTLWQATGNSQVKINKRIDAADFFLLFLSPSATKSHWVKKELSYAQQKEEKPHPNFIHVAYYKSCELSNEFAFLKNRLCADFQKEENFIKGFGQIVANIQTCRSERPRSPLYPFKFSIAPTKATYVMSEPLFDSFVTRVFISYAHEDLEFVEKIRTELKKSGIFVLIDVQFMRSLELEKEIKENIDAADFFLLFLSPSATKSHWVKEELSYARQKEEKLHTDFIHVAYYKSCEFSNEFAFLKNRLYADFRNEENVDKASEQIIASIQAMRRLIILMGDAPVNYEAQKSIVEALRHIIRRWRVKLILLGGSEGDASLSYLRNYGTPEIRLEVAEEYLKAGEIAAEEYLDIVSDEPLILHGVDNKRQYNEAVEAFSKAKAISTKKSVKEAYKNIHEKLRLLQWMTVNEHLWQLEEILRHYEDGEALLSINALADLARKVGIDMRKYPTIAALRKAKDMESFDPEKVEQEHVEAIKKFRLLNQTYIYDVKDVFLDVSKGVVDDTSYFQMLAYLLTHYMQWQGLKNLRHYCDYRKLMGVLNPATLEAEVYKLANSLRDKLAKTELESEIVHATWIVELMGLCAINELRPLQYEEYQRYQESIDSAVKLVEKISDEADIQINCFQLHTLVNAASEVAEYYRKVKKRTVPIVHNTLQTMEKMGEKKAVLITSGWIVEFVKRRFIDEGLAVIPVLPKFSEHTDEERYKQVLLSRSGLGDRDTRGSEDH